LLETFSKSLGQDLGLAVVVLFVVCLLVVGEKFCLVVWRGVVVVVRCDETVFLFWLSLSENISFCRS